MVMFILDEDSYYDTTTGTDVVWYSRETDPDTGEEAVLTDLSTVQDLSLLSLANRSSIPLVVQLSTLQYTSLVTIELTAVTILGRSAGSVPSLPYTVKNLSIVDCSTDSIGLQDILNAVPEQIQTVHIRNLKSNAAVAHSIVEDIDRLHSIVQLSICSISVQSIPNSMYRLTTLHSLIIRDCDLTGMRISRRIGQLTDLHLLDLQSNGLTGRIPKRVSRLTNLRSLDLSHNRLRGPIPMLPTGLTELYLNSNRLTRLPNTVSRLTDLLSLDLSRNRLRGTVPTHLFSTMTHLRTLYLSSNRQLSGYIEVPDRCRIRYRNTKIEL